MVFDLQYLANCFFLEKEHYLLFSPSPPSLKPSNLIFSVWCFCKQLNNKIVTSGDFSSRAPRITWERTNQGWWRLPEKEGSVHMNWSSTIFQGILLAHSRWKLLCSERNYQGAWPCTCQVVSEYSLDSLWHYTHISEKFEWHFEATVVFYKLLYFTQSCFIF